MGSRESGAQTAVFFIGREGITRHMLFSEFEALLDGLVALPDYKDEDARAVYVVLNKFGQITSLVFFNIYFDEDGRADAGWNIPVERLSDISGKGPDLGAGPIRLACRSQCAINWHQNELWDPDMTPGSNDFLLIKKAVSENRLRLKFEAPEEDVPTLSSNEPPVVTDTDLDLTLEQQKRIKLARLLKEQRLRIRTLESHRDRAAGEGEREQRIIIHAYKNEIQSLKQTNEQLRLQNEKLQEKLSSRNEQFIDLQDKVSGQSKKVEELENRLKTATGGEREQIERQKLEAEVVLLREQLERRNIDLANRDEREDLLRAELEEIKEAQSGSSTGGDVLNKLNELEVVYTAYHPGVGHVTMSGSEIRDYVENPVAFVAAKSFVTEEQYRAWLDHFENPVCRHKKADGTSCLKPIEKVSSPSDFELGVEDRCAQHKPEGFS